jgi:hypothetical protein
MTFDATTVPPASTAQARIIQHSLIGLDPAFSHISNVVPVARFLSAMFPNLKKMEWDQIWGDNRQLWNEVWTLVAELHEIRTEELMRGQSFAAQTLAR